MTEGVLFDFAGRLLVALEPSAYEELALKREAKEELSKLKDTVSLARAVLGDAEEQQRFNNHEVATWLGNLKDALYDMDDYLEDLSTEALRRKAMSGNQMVKKLRIFLSGSYNLADSVKMCHRVKAFRARLDAIAADSAKFHFSDRPLELLPVVMERGQRPSFVRAQEMIGRDDDKMKIVQLLLQSEPKEDVSIVPIVGIGGLGKTTLAKMVFNDEKIQEHFLLKMWVDIPKKFELKVIVLKLIEAATGINLKKDLRLETLQRDLRDSINGKKYVLVFDDVWNEDLNQWLSLKTLLVGGASGSCIVITTRSEVVARITSTVSSHALQGLSRSESWSLLKQMAGKEESSESKDQHLEAIGMEIVDQCHGVPLALRAIGRVLYKRETTKWITVKDNVHKYLTQPESGIIPILKLSYDHLPSHLKKCFAYCSLIPKDTKFKVKKLVRYWMAQGFIQPSNGADDLEDVGREYFMDLLWRSFFQVAKEDDSGNVERFTMHDLMHDLARSVAGNEYCIANSEGGNANESTRHVSFCVSEFPNALLKATRAKSFIRPITMECPSVLNAICFEYLRMLDFSASGIQILPYSIGELKHLRDFDLSRNEDIRELPESLSKLVNLQTLDLHYCCKLEKLPESLSRLVNLQTLDLHDCWSLEKLPSKTSRLASLMSLDIGGFRILCTMPREMGKLTCLRRLSNFVIMPGRCELTELNQLNKLGGSLSISSLEDACIPEPGSTYLKHKLNLKSLELVWNWRWTIAERHYDIQDFYVSGEMIFECLEPHPNLEELRVLWYPGIKISSWFTSMINLTELALIGCCKCKHLPPLHQISSLKHLELKNLYALVNTSENELQKELFPAESTIIFFPSLQKLIIHDCSKLKGWWRSSDDVEASISNAQMPSFPRLSYLSIENCPNLTSMPLFPSVNNLCLRDTKWNPLIQPTLTMKIMMSTITSSSRISPFSELETLDLFDMEDVDSLPEELLRNLISLRYLHIQGCDNLASMPEGMRHLISLKKLRIHGCPRLRERCKRDIGVDWPNIAHIPQVVYGWL